MLEPVEAPAVDIDVHEYEGTYVFTGYENAVSRNIKSAVMDALHVGADVDQPGLDR